MCCSSDKLTPVAQQPSVVLLHASASSARQWSALGELLRPRFRVRVLDLHGHGARPAWRGDAPFTLADDAALAAPLLDPAGAVHLVGHSYGAAVALKLATLHPRSVRSVVVYEPVLFRWLIDDPARHHHPVQDVIAVATSMRERHARGESRAAAQRFVDFWSGTGAWDALSAEARDAIAPRVPALLRQFDALFREPMPRARLSGLDVPMLFLSGARTIAVARRIADLLRAALPDAGHDILPQMGHMGPITHAAEVNSRIAAFLHACEDGMRLPAPGSTPTEMAAVRDRA